MPTEEKQQTQRQLLWEMGFSKRLEPVISYERSLAYHEAERDRYARSNAKGAKEKKENFTKSVELIRKDVFRLREALEQWVKEHPYPTA